MLWLAVFPVSILSEREHCKLGQRLNWTHTLVSKCSWRTHALTVLELQAKVDEAYKDKEKWAKKCIMAVSGMGFFSTDRTIQVSQPARHSYYLVHASLSSFTIALCT